jgi:anti-anti-sigma regulatory factor
VTDERLTWRLEEESGAPVLRLYGAIDEDADFTDILESANRYTEIRIDLGGITRINSVGVREWVNFVRALDSHESVVLERCVPVVVTQLNMIANFAGTGRVVSVYAPYVCDECGHEESNLVDTSGTIDVESFSERTCPNCGETMELDDLPESYFSFATPE